ncbi:MAG TPA: trypsin-like peptidase domain-containing protein [Pyrinomonadaceae bacterium]|jgi:S1-C subfamily serine protease|nr:trypsin-like peptidase domain-containing protein [Pyrinomonadaceae bacterium]
MYRLSARQIISIALLSALFAAVTVACFDRWGHRLQPPTFADDPGAATASVAGITDPSVATDEQNNIEVFRAISPGVVSINTTTRPRGFFDTGGQGSGSGSVIDAEGHVLTNFHVIEDADTVTVSFGGEKAYPARVVGRDPDTDLAVLQVQAPREVLKVVPLGDSDRLTVGQKVLAIGNPFGLDRTLTTGVISGLQRPIQARNGRVIEGAIQTDASINQGNSGGPLLDSQGRMIGINSQIIAPSGGSVGVGFAIPVNIAKRIVPQLIRDGRVVRPKLGIYPRAVSDLRGIRLPVQEGLLILELEQGGSASAAGLRGVSQTEAGDLILGDIITAIDGEKIADQNDLYKALDKRQFNDVVQVEIYRDGRRQTVPVRLLPEQRRGVLRR